MDEAKDYRALPTAVQMADIDGTYAVASPWPRYNLVKPYFTLLQAEAQNKFSLLTSVTESIKLDLPRLELFKNQNFPFDANEGSEVVLFSNNYFCQLHSFDDWNTLAFLHHKVTVEHLTIVGVVYIGGPEYL
jgi:hypothetical protein